MSADTFILLWFACGLVVWFKTVHRNGDSFWAAILAIVGPLTLAYWAAPRSCTATARTLYRAICWLTGERPR